MRVLVSSRRLSLLVAGAALAAALVCVSSAVAQPLPLQTHTSALGASTTSSAGVDDQADPQLVGARSPTRVSPNDARRRGVAEAQASTPGSSDALPAPHPGFIWLYVLVLVLFPLVLHLADSFQAYLFARKILSTVGPNVSPVDAIAVAREATNTTTGITGVTRSIFTYTILLLLGMSVFHILVAFGNVGAADNILTVLAGAVSSIIGFYFGTKATKEGAEPKKKSVMRELPGTITAVQPKDPEQGQEVTIMGTGFGDTEGAVKVGDHVADIVQWDHNQIKVRVPGNCRPGKTPISVNPTNDREIVGPNGVIDVHQKQ